MRYEDVYGIQADDIDETATQLEKALGVDLEPRHGDKRGDFFSAKDESQVSVLLQHSFMPFGKEWFAEGYKEFPLIVMLNYDGPETRYEQALSRMTSARSALLWRYRYGLERGKSRKLFSRPRSSTDDTA